MKELREITVVERNFFLRAGGGGGGGGTSQGTACIACLFRLHTSTITERSGLSRIDLVGSERHVHEQKEDSSVPDSLSIDRYRSPILHTDRR